jgi:uncharacterized protein GlcG (DUF336 family)
MIAGARHDRGLAIAVAAIFVIIPSVSQAQPAASAPTLVTERTLSFSAAHEAAMAALEQCRKDGYTATVTVLNRAGRTVVVLHANGANPHTIENSLRKAYTSLTFRTPSGEFGKRATSTPTGAGALHLDNITTAEGAFDYGPPRARRLHRSLRGAWRREGCGVRAGRHRPHCERTRPLITCSMIPRQDR